MCNPVSLHSSSPPPEALPVKGDDRVAKLMHQVIEQKSTLAHTAKTNRWNVSEAILIGGDLFSMGYLAFEAAKIVKPALTKISAIAMTSLVCGMIAGAINIGVGFVCLKEGLQAHKNGDWKLAARLYIDFVSLVGIGIIMMLTSLALRIGALAGLSAFFAVNPWLLPVLFLGISVPVLFEVATRIKTIWQQKDYGSELKKETLGTLIQGTDAAHPYHLQPLIDMASRGADEAVIKKALSEKMETLQANIGVEAAIEAFKLMEMTLKKEEIDQQFEVTQKKIGEWNHAQYVRLAQQLLYLGAFCVSMASLTSSCVRTQAVQATETFAMTGANAIPLYMDTFWPFKRNTPSVVPMVEA